MEIAALVSAAGTGIGAIGSLTKGGGNQKQMPEALESPEMQRLRAAMSTMLMGKMGQGGGGATPWQGGVPGVQPAGYDAMNILYNRFLGRPYTKPGRVPMSYYTGGSTSGSTGGTTPTKTGMTGNIRRKYTSAGRTGGGGGGTSGGKPRYREEKKRI